MRGIFNSPAATKSWAQRGRLEQSLVTLFVQELTPDQPALCDRVGPTPWSLSKGSEAQFVKRKRYHLALTSITHTVNGQLVVLHPLTT